MNNRQKYMKCSASLAVQRNPCTARPAFLARLTQHVWGPNSGSVLAGVQPQQEAVPLCYTSSGRGEGARPDRAQLAPGLISPVLRQRRVHKTLQPCRPSLVAQAALQDRCTAPQLWAVRAQLEARPVDEEEYRAYRAATDLREPYRYVPAEVAPPCGSGGTVNLSACLWPRSTSVAFQSWCRPALPGAAALYGSRAVGLHALYTCKAVTYACMHLTCVGPLHARQPLLHTDNSLHAPFPAE